MTRHVLPAALAALLAPLAAWGQAPDPVAAPPPEAAPAAAIAPAPMDATPVASPPAVNPPAARARPPFKAGTERPYVAVRGAVVTTRGDGGRGPNASGAPDLGKWEADDAFALEAGVGTRLMRLLTAELALGGHRTTAMRRGWDGSQTVTRTTRARVLSATATVRAFAPLRGRFRLYGLVGGSFYRVDLEDQSVGSITGATPLESYSDNPLGINLGVGFGWAITQRIRFDVEAKAAPMSARFAGESLSLGGGRFGGGFQFEL